MKNKPAETDQDKRGFLKLPNPILERILQSNLSGVELKVLLVCLRWTVGYRKATCTASLSDLARATGHARKFMSNVRNKLVDAGFLQIVTPSGFRSPAKFRVPRGTRHETAVNRWGDPDKYHDLNSRISALERG